MLTGITGFFNQQWQLLVSIVVGLFALWRVVDHIGQARIDNEVKQQLQDTISRMNGDAEFIKQKRDEMRDLTIHNLLDGMRSRGETRIDTELQNNSGRIL